MVRTLLLVGLTFPLQAPAVEPTPTQLGSDRFRQADRVTAITYSPDGRQLATGGEGSIHLWDVADGVRRDVTLGRSVMSLCYTDRGRTLLAAADGPLDHSTELFRIDPAAGKVLHQVRVLDGGSFAHFSPDGAWLVLFELGDKHGYRCIDTATGKTAWAQATTRENDLTAHAFRPDGRALAVAEADGRILIREPATGTVRHDFRLTGGAAAWLTYTPDGKDLIADIADYKVARVARIAAGSGTERWSRPVARAREIAFTPDGRAIRYLGRGISPGEPYRWHWLDARTGEPLDRTLTTEFDAEFATSPDGRMLAVASFRGHISQWDLEAGKRREAGSADPPEGVTHLRFTADGAKVRGWARGWYEWDVRTGRQTRLTPNLDRWMTELMAVSDDQRVLARVVGQNDPRALGAVELIDLATGRARPTRLPRARYRTIRFAPDGRLLVTDGGGIRVVDPALGECTVEISWDHTRGSSSIDRDGTTAITIASAGGRLAMTRWDLGTGKPVDTWEGQTLSPEQPDGSIGRAGHFSTAGRVLGVTFDFGFGCIVERRAAFYDMRTGRGLPGWGGDSDLADVEFSPDGRIVCTRRRPRIHEVATGGRRMQLPIPEAEHLALSPDGATLAVPSSPAPLVLWDLVGRPTGPWDAVQPADLWARLAAENAETAFAAIRHLRHHPPEAVAFLKERVKLPTARDADWIAARIKGLDAPQFRDRETATADLAAVLPMVRPELQAALKTASAEARRRLEGLLERVDVPNPEAWRAARACEALEGIGTPAARELLATWAKGPAAATLTREAGESAGRLAKR